MASLTIKDRICNACGKESHMEEKKFYCCEKCKSAYYCSPECQKYDWENGHKENCKRMHKLRKYNKKGTKYSEIYELEDATKKYNKSLKAAKKLNDHKNIAKAYRHLGEVQMKLGKFAEAQNYFDTSLKELSKEDHPRQHDVALIYDSMGDNYLKQAKLDLAHQKYELSLEIRQQLVGDKTLNDSKRDKFRDTHLLIAKSFFNLGCLYLRSRDIDMAKLMLAKCKRIQLKFLNEDHPDMASTYVKFALIYGTDQSFDGELQVFYLKKALYITQTKFGENHPSVAEIYHNLAHAYHKLLEKDHYNCFRPNEQVELDSRGKKALKYYEKSIKIYINVLGENHPDVAFAYNSIGCFYGAVVKNYNKAIEYMHKAVQIEINAYGESHNEVGFSYINIGNFFLWQKEYRKALDYYEKACSILKIKLTTGLDGVLDPETIHICKLGILHRKKEQNRQKKIESNQAEDASDHKKMERKPEDLSNDWISVLNNENAHDSNRKKKKKKNNKKKKKKKR